MVKYYNKEIINKFVDAVKFAVYNVYKGDFEDDVFLSYINNRTPIYIELNLRNMVNDRVLGMQFTEGDYYCCWSCQSNISTPETESLFDEYYHNYTFHQLLETMETSEGETNEERKEN